MANKTSSQNKPSPCWRSDRCKRLRKDRKITQKKMGQILGISSRTYGRYETGDNRPYAEIIISIARALYTSSDYLLGLTDNPSPDSEIQRFTGLSDNSLRTLKTLNYSNHTDDRHILDLINLLLDFPKYGSKNFLINLYNFIHKDIPNDGGTKYWPIGDKAPQKPSSSPLSVKFDNTNLIYGLLAQNDIYLQELKELISLEETIDEHTAKERGK